jgi:hypothetical protein
VLRGLVKRRHRDIFVNCGVKYAILEVIMIYNVDFLKELINIPKSKIGSLYRNYYSYIKERLKIRKDYNIVDNVNFNIFTSISDTYYKENFHSDVIKYILDPGTEKIGNRLYIECFTNLLKRINPKLNVILEGKIYVYREMNKIDIFICDDNMNGIIIENKMNYAKDQRDQLGRYYKKMLLKGYKINSIVYLTLTPDKKIDLNYSVINKSMQKDIVNLLIHLSAINLDGQYSFSIDFVDECVKMAKTEYSRVYLLEYSELVKYLGGLNMSSELDKQTLLDIFHNEESFNNFNILGDLWLRKNELLSELVFEKLMYKHNFLQHPGDKNVVCKQVDDELFVAFHKDFSFGFVFPPTKSKFTLDQRKKWTSILKEYTVPGFFTDEEACDTEHWIWKTIDINHVNIVETILREYVNFENYLKTSGHVT